MAQRLEVEHARYRERGTHHVGRQVGPDLRPAAGQHHGREVAAGRVPCHDDATRVAAIDRGVAIDPGQGSHGLQNDVVDADGRAQAVVGQHDHGAGSNEGQRDERLVALVERAPVAAVEVNQDRCQIGGRRGRQEDVELLGRIGTPARGVGQVKSAGQAAARRSRCVGPALQDGGVLGNAAAVVVLLVVPGVGGHHRPAFFRVVGRTGGAAWPSRIAASISASAIHNAMLSTSRSGRPQMSFRMVKGSMP